MPALICSAGFLLLLAGCAFAPAVSPPRYKLLISSDGMYRVTGAMLRGAGVDPDRIDPATVQLFRDDREVATRVQGEKDDLTVEFYGQANDTGYSAFRAYGLRWGVAIGKRMRQVALAPVVGMPQESFQDTIRVARPAFYVPQSEFGAAWYWQALIAPMMISATITLPAALPAPAHLHVNLRGNSEATESPNHHITVFFNDTLVAEDKWSGIGGHPIDAAVPAVAIRAGENTLRLIAPGDTRAQADLILLSSIEVTYARRFVADADTLVFQGGSGTFCIEGFSDDAVELYDISDPIEPARLPNVSLGGRAMAFRIEADSPRRWQGVGPAGFKSPMRIAPMTASNLRSTIQQADYLVITHPTLADALKPLVQWREKQGLKVSVVTTDEIYDEFNFGAESPLAIRALIEWASRYWGRPAPRFVLLVGKASYDYLNYLNGANPNLLPTYLVTTPHLGQAASDNWFVAPDDANGRPALAIGRIPAKTADQVARVVRKIIAVESAPPADWRHRAIFVADDKEPGFAQSADALAAQTKMQLQKIYLAAYQGNVDPARADVIRDWNAGAGLVTFIGHGSINTWAAGPLLSADQLDEIRNGDRLPILFTPTCLDGFFYHPQVDSLAEDLLFKNDGGIVAGLAPTGLSLLRAQDAVMQNIFEEIFDQRAATLGEAIMRAKQETSEGSSDTREVIDTFGLLGDPALRLNPAN